MKRAALKTLATLSIAIENDEPPPEFRIFREGENPTSKGTFVFDAQAAASVMADFKRHGVDVMIDLEHLSLDENARHFDPNARGWLKLELRKGELWAAGVSWTEDGDRRLRKKEQRYISPAFDFDTKTKRVLRLTNVAITAMPATHGISPLVAAAERTGSMDAIIAQLGLAPGATEEEIVAAIKALQEKAAADEEAAKAAKASETKAETEKAAAKAALAARSANEGELAKEVAKLRAEADSRDVREVIASNREKCTPALEKWALTQTAQTLRDFFAVAPSVAKPPHQEPNKTDPAKVELTADDRAVCKATGMKPADFLAQKQKLAARAAEGEV